MHKHLQFIAKTTVIVTALLACGPVSVAAEGTTVQMDELTVVARRGRLPGGETTNGFDYLAPGDSVAAPQSIAQILQNQPGIGFSGQGGLFQTISVRGLSRQRVANYFLDVPILTERRAGTSSSFIDPMMLGDIELLRGPASTHYGSGAMGGVLQLVPTKPTSTAFELGWGSAGDENLQHLAAGNEVVGFGLSHRGANNSQSSDGTALNTGFDQYNAKFNLSSGEDSLRFSLDSLASVGREIGKSNTRYPDDRVTEYPEEHHWITQASLDSLDAWHASLWFHYQDLVSTVERVEGAASRSESESLDLGGTGYLDWGTDSWPVRLGVDYLARRDVLASEQQWDAEGLPVSAMDNLDAEQDQLGFYLDSNTSAGPVLLAAGLRQSWVTQDSTGSRRESDNAASGFARGSWYLSHSNTLHLELASAVRFPSLSERYFSGVTGRGAVVGNPTLDPEQSASVELGFNSSLPETELVARFYYTWIEDFIARVEIGPETLTYLNQDEGEIGGAEIFIQHTLTEQLSLTGSGQYLKGRDQNDDGLQDIAPNSLSAGVAYDTDRWSGKLSYQYRFSKDDVSAVERPADSAQLLTAEISMKLGANTTLKFWGRNLLDDTYWISTDDLSTRGEERSLGLSIAWQQQ